MRPGEDGEHFTFCRLCEAFCGTVATVRDGRLVKVSADPNNPHSKGHICVKGPTITAIVNDVDRVLHPLKRSGRPGQFERVSWDAALADIGNRLSHILQSQGPVAFAAYFGNPGAFSTDTSLSSRWFMQQIGATKFYTAGTQDSTSRHLASYCLYGLAFRNAIPDLANCDLLLIFGANPLISHGSLLTAPRIRQDLDTIAGRGRVVVVDPRRSETAERYEHISISPDSDVHLLAIMLTTIFAEGLADIEFLNEHVAGWERFRDALFALDEASAEAETGIPLEAMRSLARDFYSMDRAAAYGRVGVCRGSFSTLTNVMIDALNIVTGKFGAVGCSTFGAFPLGAAPNPREGYDRLRTRIGNIPVVAGMMATAVLADDIVEPGEGQVKAMMLVAGNPVLSAPGAARLEKALDSLDLLFACDLYMNESNRYADYILPAATFMEKDDLPLLGLSHMVRPYIQYSTAVIPKQGEAREEFDIFNGIVDHLEPALLVSNAERGQKTTPRPIELVEQAMLQGPLSAMLEMQDGLSFAKLREAHPHGLALDLPLAYDTWPERVGHEDRRIHLWNDVIAGEFSRLQNTRRDRKETLKLFSRRHLKSLNSWMHNFDKLTRSQHPALLINPKDAEKRGISTGDLVTVSSSYGAVNVAAEITSSVVEGAVCYPHGWGHGGGWQHANAQPGTNINVLLQSGPSGVEAVSGTSFIDGIPVEVERTDRATLVS